MIALATRAFQESFQLNVEEAVGHWLLCLPEPILEALWDTYWHSEYERVRRLLADTAESNRTETSND